MNKIGTLQENSLHAALKAWYTQPEDQIETAVDGYVIDLVRSDLLIEIQTGNFSAIKRKLAALLEAHPVRLIYPISYEKWILRLAGDGITQLSRRKSPKRGKIFHLFQELVRIPRFVLNANFSVEVLMVRAEVVWREDGRGSWRRKGRSIIDQRLIEVISRQQFSGPQDYRSLLPTGLPAIFTVKELARLSDQSVRCAGQMAYCLREMGVLEPVGKRGRAIVYQRS